MTQIPPIRYVSKVSHTVGVLKMQGITKTQHWISFNNHMDALMPVLRILIDKQIFTSCKKKYNVTYRI